MKKLWMNPVIAGVCNAAIPGLGYVLINQRRIFGWLLIVGSLLYALLCLIEPAFFVQPFMLSESVLGKVLEVIMYATFYFAFAYDAYALAKSTAVHENLPVIISSSEAH